MTTLPTLFIILCAFCGLLLATFIHFKKRHGVPLICPIGHSCDPVVHSDYSKFMHVPVEVLGVLYYLLIAVGYSLFAMYPSMKTGGVEIALLGISAFAFLFSIYLTAVQAFILREWCTWCLISALFCATIFLAALNLLGASMIPFS